LSIFSSSIVALCVRHIRALARLIAIKRATKPTLGVFPDPVACLYSMPVFLIASIFQEAYDDWQYNTMLGRNGLVFFATVGAGK
jgi:hypothetical protein